EPVVADRAIGRELAALDLAIFADDERDGVALLVTRHGALRYEQRIAANTLFDSHAHEHARQELVLGVRYDRAQGDRARRLIDGDIGELQRALLVVVAAILEDDRDLRFLR